MTDIARSASARQWQAKWSIGIYSGPSPLELSPLAANTDPVFTAEHIPGQWAGFVADPFLFPVDGRWFMFFEIWNRKRQLGEIGCAVSGDLLHWEYLGLALSEPFHLSYPHVFKAGGRFYLLPETKQAGAVRLYRAREFPLTWTLERELFAGNYADPSPFFHEGRWWIFAQRGLDELRIFHAPEPEGPWQRHADGPQWPGNRTYTRPAGRTIHYQNAIYRFAQDGSISYGNNVRMMEVNVLDPEAFLDREISRSPFLGPGESGWNAMGMHHIDLHQTAAGPWIAAVDGANLGCF